MRVPGRIPLLRRAGGPWLAMLLILLMGCSSDAGEPRQQVAVRPGSHRVEFLTFGTVSSYVEDAPLVIRPDIFIDVIAADRAHSWIEDVAVPQAVIGPGSIGAFYRPESTMPWWLRGFSTTDGHGRVTFGLTPGQYLVCPHFYARTSPFLFPLLMVAGCDHIDVHGDTTVYVFFDEGRAFIDTGQGPAGDAYRKLSCHQQRRLGQRPDALVHSGGGRYRCPSR